MDSMKAKGLLLLSALVVLSSCGGITKEEFEKRIGSIENRIAQLEDRQRLLEERSIKTESRLDNLSESLATTRLELEKLKLAQERRQLSQPTLIPPPAPKQPKEEKGEAKQQAQQAEGKREPQSELREEDYKREYEEALRLYNLRQLNQAKERFIDFIKKYPNTDLTDNAYLWLGAVYRELGELNKAEAVWLTLVERCKRKEMVDCNKAPSALLQLARLSEQKGDSAKAKEYYETILKDYPLSEEAQTARQKLGR